MGGAFNFIGDEKHLLSGLESKFVICLLNVDKTRMLISSFPVNVKGSYISPFFFLDLVV